MQIHTQITYSNALRLGIRWPTTNRIDRMADKTIARTAHTEAAQAHAWLIHRAKSGKRSIIENRIRINREARVRVFGRAIVIACDITIDSMRTNVEFLSIGGTARPT